jgi:hypothetical protein
MKFRNFQMTRACSYLFRTKSIDKLRHFSAVIHFFAWFTQRGRERVTVTLRLAVYRQSVRLGATLLETHGQNFFFQLNTCVHGPYVTFSTISAGPRQRIHSQVRVPQDSWPHFTISDSRLPQLGGQVTIFISPRNRVAQLYPQSLGSLSAEF